MTMKQSWHRVDEISKKIDGAISGANTDNIEQSTLTC
jgi:hypothetical protein